MVGKCLERLDFGRFVRKKSEKRGLTETGVKMMSFLYKALLKNRAEIAKQQQEKEEEEEEQHIKSGQPITIAC